MNLIINGVEIPKNENGEYSLRLEYGNKIVEIPRAAFPVDIEMFYTTHQDIIYAGNCSKPVSRSEIYPCRSLHFGFLPTIDSDGNEQFFSIFNKEV